MTDTHVYRCFGIKYFIHKESVSKKCACRYLLKMHVHYINLYSQELKILLSSTKIALGTILMLSQCLVEIKANIYSGNFKADWNGMVRFSEPFCSVWEYHSKYWSRMGTVRINIIQYNYFLNMWLLAKNFIGSATRSRKSWIISNFFLTRFNPFTRTNGLFTWSKYLLKTKEIVPFQSILNFLKWMA